jgi:acetylornithine deacetylase
MKGFFAFILDALRDVDVSKLKKPLYIRRAAGRQRRGQCWPTY